MELGKFTETMILVMLFTAIIGGLVLYTIRNTYDMLIKKHCISIETAAVLIFIIELGFFLTVHGVLLFKSIDTETATNIEQVIEHTYTAEEGTFDIENITTSKNLIVKVGNNKLTIPKKQCKFISSGQYSVEKYNRKTTWEFLNIYRTRHDEYYIIYEPYTENTKWDFILEQYTK